MCKGTCEEAWLAVATGDDSTHDDIVWQATDWVEVATFDRFRLLWDLLSSTGELELQAHVAWSQNGLEPVGGQTLGSASTATGLHVGELTAPDPAYRFAMFGVRAQRSSSSTLDVEAGVLRVAVELR